MAFSVKDIIFGLFTESDQRTDNGGGGLVKRFNEMLAEDLDQTALEKLQNIWANTIHADTIDSRLINNLETFLGLPFIAFEESKRRLIIKHAFDLYKNKGNVLSYDILFNILGYGGATVEKLSDKYDYNLKLKTQTPLTTENIAEIIRGVSFLEPIYTGVFSIESDKLYDTFYIEVLPNGNLVYETLLDITLSLSNGNLFIENNTTNSYSLDANGNFIKN